MIRPFLQIMNEFVSNKRLLAMCFVLILGNWTLPAFSQSQKQQYQVTANRLNVRKAASQQSSVIGSLNRGDVVTVLSIKDDWATISYNGQTAFVSSNYLQSTKELSSNKNLGNSSSESIATGDTYSNRIAQWQLGAAIMPHKSGLDWSFLIGGDFPLQIGGIDFWLHGGLRYLQCRFGGSDEYMYYNTSYNKMHLIELPIKLDYDIPLSRDVALSVGAGPYYSYNLTTESRALGLEPEVAVKYKRWSLSLQYSLPVFKSDDYIGARYPMLNLSVSLGNKTMGYVAAGLVTAATVAVAIGSAVSGESFDGFDSYDSSSSVNTDNEGRYSVRDLLARTQAEVNNLQKRYDSLKNVVESEKTKSDYARETGSYVATLAGELGQKKSILNHLRRKQQNGIDYITSEEWDDIVEQAYQSDRDKKRQNDARRDLKKQEKESQRLRKSLDKHTKALEDLNRKLD